MRRGAGRRRKRRARKEELWARARRAVREALRDTGPSDDSLVEAIRELRASFPSKSESWFIRAAYRCLVGVRWTGTHWLVPGLPELGDEYGQYNVYFKNGRYECDCYHRAWGRRRRKEICTHIAAVILHRRQKKITEY